MARVSFFSFWAPFGVRVWALRVPWRLVSLDMSDRTSGGRILGAEYSVGALDDRGGFVGDADYADVSAGVAIVG